MKRLADDPYPERRRGAKIDARRASDEEHAARIEEQADPERDEREEDERPSAGHHAGRRSEVDAGERAYEQRDRHDDDEHADRDSGGPRAHHHPPS
jgi:hypothetical protein